MCVEVSEGVLFDYKANLDELNIAKTVPNIADKQG